MPTSCVRIRRPVKEIIGTMISRRNIWRLFSVMITLCIVGQVVMIFMSTHTTTNDSGEVLAERHFQPQLKDGENEQTINEFYNEKLLRNHDTEFIKIKRSGIRSALDKIQQSTQRNISRSRIKQKVMLERKQQDVDLQQAAFQRLYGHNQHIGLQVLENETEPLEYDFGTPRLQGKTTTQIKLPDNMKPVQNQRSKKDHIDNALKSGNEEMQTPTSNSLLHKSRDISFLNKSHVAPYNHTCEYGNVTINPFARGPKPYGSKYRSKTSSEPIPSDCAPIWFASTSLPVIALASAPGSGNTWLRHLIQQLTGVFTGAVYYDSELFEAGFWGEYMISPQLVAIKTHEHWNCSLVKQQPAPPMPYLCPQYQKAILVIRDPYEAAVAEFHRLLTAEGRHTDVIDKSYYYTDYWQQHVVAFLQKWRDTNLAWLNFPNRGCLYVTSYKHLKTRLKDELIALGRFLNVDRRYLTGDHLNCVLNNKNGLFKRPYHEIPTDIFSDEIDQLMRLCRRNIEMKLKMVGQLVTF